MSSVRAGTAPEARPSGAPGREITREMIARLREALRGTDERALDAAAAPVMDRMYRPLLRYCDAMLRGAPAAKRMMEAEDLALEAWHKTLRHLRGERGDRVAEPEHFERLIRCAARSIMLDLLDRPSTALNSSTVEIDERDADERSAAGRSEDRLAGPNAAMFLADHRHLQLVEILFTQEDRFRAEFRQANQRHPRHYRALVLYELGAFLRDEALGDGSEEGREYMVRLMRRYVGLMGIPEAYWGRIEQAALEEATSEEEGSDLVPSLRDAVNEVCGTRITGRAFLSVLRYEMNRFAHGAGPGGGRDQQRAGSARAGSRR